MLTRRRCLLALPLASSCARRASSLPELGRVPPFEFTNLDGKTFSSKMLEGKVWVVDFFFTNCPGPCPRMSKQLQRVQAETQNLANFRLVSITVDPARDTPQALAAYARRHQADPARWFFLTGRQDLIGNLMSEAFYLGYADSMEQHSTKFVLVDPNMRVRGFYDSFDPPGQPGESIAQLLKGIQELHDRS
jgi:protein SCO1/2